MILTLTQGTFGPLAPHLIDLAATLETKSVPLILVGGFGLVVRRAWREAEGVMTLIADVPPARATEDFDVLLRLDILADAGARQAYRDALATLGYVTHRENFQFIKPGSGGPGRDVKVDFLAQPPEPHHTNLKVKSIRVGAKDATRQDSLHGFLTQEAVAAYDGLLPVTLAGPGTDGQDRQARVHLPHPYALLLMKLHAFRDEHEGRKKGDRSPYADKHAKDLYTLAALVTADEADALGDFRARYGTHPAAAEASRIVQALFTTPDSEGTLRVRTAFSNTLPPGDVAAFLNLLRDAF